MLEEFEVYAGQRSIQPSVAEWVRERDWVQSRLKQEIFNQAVGVAKGDEVEAQRDPVVRAALEHFAKVTPVIPARAPACAANDPVRRA